MPRRKKTELGDCPTEHSIEDAVYIYNSAYRIYPDATIERVAPAKGANVGRFLEPYFLNGNRHNRYVTLSFENRQSRIDVDNMHHVCFKLHERR